MARVTGVKLNMKGISDVLKEAQPVVDEAGKAIARRAGEGFEYRASPHRYTARGYVETRTARARRAEAIEKRLTSSLDGGAAG